MNSTANMHIFAHTSLPQRQADCGVYIDHMGKRYTITLDKFSPSFNSDYMPYSASFLLSFFT